MVVARQPEPDEPGGELIVGMGYVYTVTDDGDAIRLSVEIVDWGELAQSLDEGDL